MNLRGRTFTAGCCCRCWVIAMGAFWNPGNWYRSSRTARSTFAYYDDRLPIDPRTYGLILGPAADALREQLGPEHPSSVELASILRAVQNLPPRLEPNPERIAEGRVEIAAIRRRLSELPERFPEAAGAVNGVLTTIAGTPGDPASFAAA